MQSLTGAEIFYYPEHAGRANFLCSGFCSTSKYSRMLGEQLARRCARRTSRSTTLSLLAEHARRASSR
uniref:Uncharacterized protein n=1 Tax=Romanomermis culicivorax TaxID=13658 RepID=A0A915IK80_ROMCU